jgi:hypothetical protein
MIEDSLGRTVDAGGMSLPDLKGMLSSLMSGKTTAQPLPESAKTPDKSAAAKETYNILKQINTNLSQNFSQQKALLDQVVNLVKNSGSGGESKSLGSSIEKFSLSLSEQSAKSNALSGELNNTTQAMKSYGQNISKLDRTMSSMTGMLRAVMGSALKQMGGGGDGGFGKIASKELADLNKNEKSAAALEKVHGGKLSELATHGLKKGSIFTHDVRMGEILNEIRKNNQTHSIGLISKIERDNKNNTLRAEYQRLETRQSSLKIVSGVVDGIGKVMSLVTKAATYARKASGAPSVTEAVMGGHQGSAVEQFGGMMEEQRKITMEARKIAYETQGITGATRELQEEFLVTEETAMRTGVARLDLQKRLLQDQRLGVKDQKTLKDITIATVNAEQQLGMEAGSLGNDFVKLHQEAGFTKGQVAATGKAMQDVAKSSGLSGAELKKAMDSSKGILDNMKNTTTLTVQAIKNVTSVMAEAQKLGVTEDVSKLLTAASSSSQLFLNASDKTKTLLYQAAGAVGRISDLQNGTLLKTRKGMGEMAQGMEKVLSKYVEGGIAGIDKMSDEQKNKLSMRLKLAYDMDLGTFERTIKAGMEGAKGYATKLEEINKMANRNGNTSLDNEIKKSAEIKKQALLQEASGGVVTSFEEALKKAGTGPDSLKKAMESINKELANEKSDLSDTIKVLGVDKGAGAEQVIQAALKQNIDGLNKKLADVGLASKQIDKTLIEQATKDPELFRQLQDNATKLEQEALAEEKAQTDPALKAQREMLKLNDAISRSAMNTANYSADILGYQGILAAAGLEYAAEQVKYLIDILSSLGFLWTAITSLPMFLIRGIGGFFTRLGGSISRMIPAGLGTAVSGIAKRIPLIGAAVDFGTRLYKGEGVGKAAAGGVGALAGGAAGAAIGTAILGPIGTVLGGIVGAFFGSDIGAWAYDSIIKPIVGVLIDFGKKVFGLWYDYIWTPQINFFKWMFTGLPKLFVNYVWTPFINFFGWLGSKIGTLFIDYIWKPYVSFWTWVGTSIMRLFMDYIWTPLKNFFGWLGGTALGGLFMEYIWTPFADFWMWVGTTIASMFVENIWNPIVGFFGWMGTAVGGLFMDYFWNPIVGFFSWVGSAVEGLFMDSFWNPIVSAFGWVIDKVTGLFTGMWDMVKNAFGGVAEWFGSWGSSIWDFLYKGASTVGLGWLLGKATPAAAAAAPTATSMTTAGAVVPKSKEQLLNDAKMMNAATQAQLQQRSMVMEAQKNIEQMRQTDPAKAIEMAKELQKDIERNANSKSPGTTRPGPTMPGQATPVTPGGPAVSAAPSMSGPMVPPYQTMAATRTGTASVTMNPTVGGLGDLAKVGQSELEYAKQQVDLLSKILTSLSSGGGGGSATTAPAKTATGGTDNYFKLPTGNFNESSIREVTNL